jgi:hypothetical protein
MVVDETFHGVSHELWSAPHNIGAISSGASLSVAAPSGLSSEDFDVHLGRLCIPVCAESYSLVVQLGDNGEQRAVQGACGKRVSEARSSVSCAS